MKSLILMTGVEPTEYVTPQLRELEAFMTPDERDQALIKGWNVKGVEPGGDDVFTYRIAAEHAPADIESLVFSPVEVDSRGVTGRGYVRSGQTKGSVASDTIIFQAVALTPATLEAIQAEQKRRAAQAKADTARRSGVRDRYTALRAAIELRIKAGGAEAVGTANGTSAASGRAK